mgnify:CR=1 FL=1
MERPRETSLGQQASAYRWPRETGSDVPEVGSPPGARRMRLIERSSSDRRCGPNRHDFAAALPVPQPLPDPRPSRRPTTRLIEFVEVGKLKGRREREEEAAGAGVSPLFISSSSSVYRYSYAR